MRYIWGRDVETHYIRVWELLEKHHFNKDGVITRPHLTYKEIYDKLSYLYKNDGERAKVNCRNDLAMMVNHGGLRKDKDGKYYV